MQKRFAEDKLLEFCARQKWQVVAQSGRRTDAGAADATAWSDNGAEFTATAVMKSVREQ